MEWHPFIALPFWGALLPLFVPVGIHQIVVCNLLVQLLGLLRIYFLDELGGDSSPDASRLDDRIAQYQGTSGDNSPFAHYCVVKDGGTHPYQSIVLDSGSVDGHVVPHGYVVSYLYGRFLVQGVEHASILDVYSVPYAD